MPESSNKAKVPVCVVIEDSANNLDALELRLRELEAQSRLPARVVVMVPAVYVELVNNRISSDILAVSVTGLTSTTGTIERNAILHTLREDWIAFMQEGYGWHPNYLEAMLNDEQEASLLLCNVDIPTYEGPKPPSLFEHWPGFAGFCQDAPWKLSTPSQHAFQLLLSEPVMTASSMLLSVHALKRTGGFDSSLPLEAQFWDAALRASLQGKVMATPCTWVRGPEIEDATSASFITASEAMIERYQEHVLRLPRMAKRRLLSRLALAYSMSFQAKRSTARALRSLITATFWLPDAVVRGAWQCLISRACFSKRTPELTRHTHA